jgi:uncharacterized membrane protein
VGVADSSHVVASLAIWFANTQVYEGDFERSERSDVVKATGRNDWLKSGWLIDAPLPSDLESGEYPVKVLAKLDTGQTAELVLPIALQPIHFDGHTYQSSGIIWAIGIILIVFFALLYTRCARTYHRRLMPSGHQFVVIFFLATCLNCVIAWLTPPFSMPDEAAHYLRSFEVSRGHWLNKSGDVGIPMPCRDYVLVAKDGQRPRVPYYQDSADKMQPNAAECLVSSVNTAGPYSPIPYIAAAFGMRAAEKLGYDVETRLKMGRIANAMVTSLICLLSILAVQRYKLMLATFALLPTSLWLRASISADAMTIAVSIGYLAYLLRLVEQDAPMTRRTIALLGLLAILLGSVKPIYGLLGFSSLIFFKRSGAWRLSLANMAALAIPGFSALIIGSMWVAAAAPELVYINTFEGADPTLQLHYLLDDPSKFATIIANTLDHNFFNFIGEALLPKLAVWPFIPETERFSMASALSVFVLFTMVTTPTALGKWQRIVFLGIASACLLPIFATLYLTYTHVGHHEIVGLQGRYFLPLFFYAVIAGCTSKPSRLFADMPTRLVIAVFIPILISATLVINYFG